MLKICSRCGSENDFPENHPKKRNYWCNPCRSKASVGYGKKNIERRRRGNNAYHARISDQRAWRTALWRSNHPEKFKAHIAVQSACRSGKLKKQNCLICGIGNTHAHHDNYAVPLNVVWLCHVHHMERHAMIRAGKGEK